MCAKQSGHSPDLGVRLIRGILGNPERPSCRQDELVASHLTRWAGAEERCPGPSIAPSPCGGQPKPGDRKGCICTTQVTTGPMRAVEPEGAIESLTGILLRERRMMAFN
jgi:hypothetical protein